MIHAGTMDPDQRAETIALVELSPAELHARRLIAEATQNVGELAAVLLAEEAQDIEAETERVFSRDPVDDDRSDQEADRYEKEIYGR